MWGWEEFRTSDRHDLRILREATTSMFFRNLTAPPEDIHTAARQGLQVGCVSMKGNALHRALATRTLCSHSCRLGVPTKDWCKAPTRAKATYAPQCLAPLLSSLCEDYLCCKHARHTLPYTAARPPCLQVILAHQKMPKEVLHNSLRPLLQNLGTYHKLHPAMLQVGAGRADVHSVFGETPHQAVARNA